MQSITSPGSLSQAHSTNFDNLFSIKHSTGEVTVGEYNASDVVSNTERAIDALENVNEPVREYFEDEIGSINQQSSIRKVREFLGLYPRYCYDSPRLLPAAVVRGLSTADNDCISAVVQFYQDVGSIRIGYADLIWAEMQKKKKRKTKQEDWDAEMTKELSGGFYGIAEATRIVLSNGNCDQVERYIAILNLNGYRFGTNALPTMVSMAASNSDKDVHTMVSGWQTHEADRLSGQNEYIATMSDAALLEQHKDFQRNKSSFEDGEIEKLAGEVTLASTQHLH